jgi:hypothetical protein
MFCIEAHNRSTHLRPNVLGIWGQSRSKKPVETVETVEIEFSCAHKYSQRLSSERHVAQATMLLYTSGDRVEHGSYILASNRDIDHLACSGVHRQPLCLGHRGSGICIFEQTHLVSIATPHERASPTAYHCFQIRLCFPATAVSWSSWRHAVIMTRLPKADDYVICRSLMFCR